MGYGYWKSKRVLYIELSEWGVVRSATLTSVVRLSEIGFRILIKTMLRTNFERLLVSPDAIPSITSPLKTVSGLYTFKAVILEEPLTCEDFGFPSDRDVCREKFLTLCEQLRETLREPDYNSFNKKVTKLLEGVSKNIAETLFHELLHAYIMKEAYALLIAEKYGWRVRFTHMYYMENLYSTIGRRLSSEVEKYGFKVHPEFRRIDGFKGLEASNAIKVLGEIQPGLKDLVTSSKNTNILRDGFMHNIHLRYLIHSIVAPIVEVTTWYVIERDIERTVDEYINKGIFDGYHHEPVLEKLIKEINKKSPDKNSIVNSANIALDFTQKEYKNFIDRIGKLAKSLPAESKLHTRDRTSEGDRDIANPVANEIINLVLKRFADALDGKKVPRAPRHLKTLGRILVYAIPSDVALGSLLTLTKILSEEGLLNPKTLLKIGDVARHHVGEYTAIHIDLKYGEEHESLGCNPITPFFGRKIKRTDSLLFTTELLVGDLVLAFKGFLSLGYMIADTIRGEGQRVGLDEFIDRIREFPRLSSLSKVLSKEPSIYDNLVARSESFLKLLESPDPKHAYNITEAFIYSVLVLGDRIKVLEGPHGLWYL